MNQQPIHFQDGTSKDLLSELAAYSELDAQSGNLTLTDEDREKIKRYAFKYGQGGWEDRLLKIFSRHLGSDLSK